MKKNKAIREEYLAPGVKVVNFKMTNPMKKFTFALMAFAMLAASCTKEPNVPARENDKADKTSSITLNITVANPNSDDATKAYIKTGWAKDDRIIIWLDENNMGQDLVIKYDGTEWQPESAIHEPTQAKGYTKSLYAGELVVTSVDDYKYDSVKKILTLNISKWTFLTKLQVVVTGLTGAASDYTLACDRFSPLRGIIPSTDCITADLDNPGEAVTGIANADGVAFVFADSNLWDENGSYAFTLKTATTEVAYTATTTIARPNGDNSKIKGLKIAASKFAEPSTGTLNGHDWVKIGGLKWATMNVGATTVAGSTSNCYGTYFQWGATSTPDGGNYDWTNAPFNGENNISYNATAWNNAKSGAIDDKNNLLAANDVANSEWGGSWRMPTSAEFQSLYEACGGTGESMINPPELNTSTPGQGIYWLAGNQTYLPEYSGVAGMLFCDGTNKVFFPAAGRVSGTSLYYGGSYGYYWSSSLYTNSEYAYSMYFFSGKVRPQYYYSHYFGFSVRPVSD